MKKSLLGLVLLLLAACGGNLEDDTMQTPAAADRVGIEQCYEDCGVGGNNGYWVDSQVAIQFTVDTNGLWKMSSLAANACPCFYFNSAIENGGTTLTGQFTLNGPGQPVINVQGIMAGTTLSLTYRDVNGNIIKQSSYPNFNGLPVIIKRKLLADA